MISPVALIKRNRISTAVFLIYVVAVSFVAWHHEPWADEAQAWLLARDSNPYDLLVKNLHYEGHPGLWYTLLIAPARLLPYRSITVISVLIASVGVGLILFRSPFPAWVRLLLPFCYYLFYQYAVIARSYVLLPTLVLLIVLVYHRRIEKPFTFGLPVILLAYTSAYTTLMAAAIMLVHLIDLVRLMKSLDRQSLIRHAILFSVFSVVVLLIVLQIWQPEDSSFARGFHFDPMSSIRMAWRIFDEAMTERTVLSAGVLAISMLWFFHKRTVLIFLLTNLAVMALFTTKYYNSWHEGIIFLAWLLAMGISFADAGGRITNHLVRKIVEIGVRVMILVVIGFHVYWAASVSASDVRGQYSAGRSVAEYIRSEGLEDARICAIRFWTTAIQPYFRHNIFANHNDGGQPAYWLWSQKGARIEDMSRILEMSPELVIIARPPANPDQIPGYELVKVYEGNLYWKDRIKETNHFAVYRKCDEEGKDE